MATDRSQESLHSAHPAEALAKTVQFGLDETLAADSALRAGGNVAATGRDPFVHGEARYEVVGTIGRGGMGRVLEANDRQFGRVVALKELIDDAASATLVQRFIIESLVTGNLEHPGIPAVYERGVRG